MSEIIELKPILDAAENLNAIDNLSEDQQLKLLKTTFFKGHEVTHIPSDKVFTEILYQLRQMPSLYNVIAQDSALRSNTVKNLKSLEKFCKGYLSSHQDVDKSVSEKIISSFSQVIGGIENLPKGEDKKHIVTLVESDPATENAIEELRIISEAILSASNFEDIQQGIQKADEVNKRIKVISPKQQDRAENFIKTIQEKVHLFLAKEVSHLKKDEDTSKVPNLKGRLKKYEELAEGWTGEHKEYLLDEIEKLNKKI